MYINTIWKLNNILFNLQIKEEIRIESKNKV